MVADKPKKQLRQKPKKETKATTRRAAEAVAITKALSHPLRRKLVICFSANDAELNSPSTLNDFLSERLGNTSYHVRTLLDLGLIEEFDTTPRRGAIEHHYRLTALGRLAYERLEKESPAEIDAILVEADS